MRYEAVVFDLDGTLLNTLSDIRASVNYALNEAGHPARSLDQVRGYVGSGARVLFERALPGMAQGEVQGCVERFKAHYRENFNVYTRPYEGIYALLERMGAAGIKAGVCSNKFDAAVKLLCDAHFGKLISACVGESDQVPKKPSPVGCQRILAEFNVAREKALYIGDSDVDVQTAQNACLDGAFVTWGFRSREELMAAGAQPLFDDIQALEAYIFR